MFSPTSSHFQTRKSSSSHGSPALGRKQQAQSNLTQKLRMMDLAIDWQDRRQVSGTQSSRAQRSPEVHRSSAHTVVESRGSRESPPGPMQAAQANTRLRRAQSAAPIIMELPSSSSHFSPVKSLQVQLELERFAGEAAEASSRQGGQAKPSEEGGAAAPSEEENCTSSCRGGRSTLLNAIWNRLGQLEASWQDAHDALGVKLSAEVREAQRVQEAKAASSLSTFELELTTALEDRSREADMLLEKRLIEVAENVQLRLAAIDASLSDDRQRIEKLEHHAGAERLQSPHSRSASRHTEAADKVLQDVSSQMDAQMSALQRELEAKAEDASTKCSQLSDQVAAKLRQLDDSFQRLQDQDCSARRLQTLDADMQQVWRRLADVADAVAPAIQTKSDQTKVQVAEELEGWRRTWDLQLAALCSRLDAMDARFAAEVPRVVEMKLKGLEDGLNRQPVRSDASSVEPPWEAPLRALGNELKALLAEQAEDSANALRSMSRIVRELRLSVTQGYAQNEGAQDPNAIVAN